MSTHHRLAVVTGANRGLGFETCRQLAERGFRVLLTSRDNKSGQAAAGKLGVDYHPLDVTNPESIARLAGSVDRVDVLVNNAGIMLTQAESAGLEALDPKTLRTTLETNLYGCLRMAQALIPLMKAHRYGRIVNVSSGLGQHSEMSTGWPAYRISKTALNALTQILAAELAGTNILVNSVCPGWVRTGMGGPSAPRSLEEGAVGIVWAATLPDDGPSGGFFRDAKPIPW